MDLEILRSTLRPEQQVQASPVYRRFWAETPEMRREKLLPFFWTTLMARHGSVAGNRSAGSSVRLSNRHRFSYPGYAEILLGETHDDTIKSNDPVRNPFSTVLEVLRDHLGVQAVKVATIASWGHFNAIVEHTEGATFVNAGQERFDGDGAYDVLNALQDETSTPWSDMRYDSFTFRIAMAHLASRRPRILYLALGETDDWAHDGRYDRVLEAYARTDGYLSIGVVELAQSWRNGARRSGRLDRVRFSGDVASQRVEVAFAAHDQPNCGDDCPVGWR
jgi:hypothetical protein